MKRNSVECPGFEALSRSVSTGVDPALASHLEGCTTCLGTAEKLSILRRVARDLPWRPLSPERVQQLEASLLAQAPSLRPAPHRRWRTLGAAIAAAAAIVGLVVGLQPEGVRVAQSRIIASADARYEHLTRHPLGPTDLPADIVQLAKGTITLQVDHLGPNERFLVATTDAEVEVRGTRFDVVAAEGKLVRVEVHEGKVEVRAAGQTRLLLPGEKWERDDPRPELVALLGPEPLPPTEVPAPTPSPVAEHLTDRVERRVHTRHPGAPPAAELAFAAAWNALREGDHARAATLFEEVASPGDRSALAADAAYWRIVALARSGAFDRAERDMERFLERHARSDRAEEVSLMLGLRRLAAGERTSARELLERAARGPGSAVGERAKEALQMLTE